MKKILMIAGDFVEDYEMMVPFQALQMAGYEVVAVAPERKHDFEGDMTYTEKRGHNFALNGDFNLVDVKKFAALVLPGGRSPEYLRLDVRVLEMIRQFDRLKKPIAAVCHGPQLLTAAGIIAGRKVSAYPAVKPEVEMAGATYVELPMTGAVTDGHFVTAPAWPAHPEWLRQLLELLK